MSDTPTDKPLTARSVPANDVMFILGVAFVVVAMVITIAVRHN